MGREQLEITCRQGNGVKLTDKSNDPSNRERKLLFIMIKAKTDGSAFLTYTGLQGQLEHLKTETRLIGESSKLSPINSSLHLNCEENDTWWKWKLVCTN